MLARAVFPVVAITAMLSVGLMAAPATAATAPPVIVPTHLPYPVGGTTVIGNGVDADNDNAQLAESVPSTIVPSWHNEAPVCPQSAGSGVSTISVVGPDTVVDEEGYQCGFVSDYSTSTGSVKWRKAYHFAESTTVTGGVAYVSHDDPGTGAREVDAITVATGRTLWTQPDVTNANWQHSVGSGLVVNSTYVLSAATGKAAFTLPIGGAADNGSSLIAGGRIFYNSDNDVEAFSPTGKILWTLTKPNWRSNNGPGNGSLIPALHDGLLYVESETSLAANATLVLNPATGAIVRTAPGSATPLAFDGDVGIVTNPGGYNAAATVSAVNMVTGRTYWTHVEPMNGQFPFTPASAPLIENGLVWFTQASDTGSRSEVVVLDEVTGAQKTDTFGACDVSYSNVAVAEHRVFVPTNCGIQTYLGTTKPVTVTPTPGELLPDPGFEKSADGWTVLGAGAVARTTSPTHTGSGSLTVTPTSTTMGTVGFAQNTVVAHATQAASYTASCWIRPSKPGLKIGMDVAVWPGGKPTNSLPTGYEVPSLVPGTWTYMTINSNTTHPGDTLSFQLFSPNASKAGGSLTIDDCSVTKVTT